MRIDDKIRDEKLQYDINIEVVKTLALTSGKIDKNEYLKGRISCHLIKTEKQSKLNLHILIQGKFLKNKQKQLKNKDKNKSKLQKF